MLALYGEDNTIEYKRFEKVTSVCEFILYTIAQTYVQKQDRHRLSRKWPKPHFVNKEQPDSDIIVVCPEKSDQVANQHLSARVKFADDGAFIF